MSEWTLVNELSAAAYDAGYNGGGCEDGPEHKEAIKRRDLAATELATRLIQLDERLKMANETIAVLKAAAESGGGADVAALVEALQNSQNLLILWRAYLDARDPLNDECATIEAIKSNRAALAAFREAVDSP